MIYQQGKVANNIGLPKHRDLRRIIRDLSSFVMLHEGILCTFPRLSKEIRYRKANLTSNKRHPNWNVVIKSKFIRLSLIKLHFALRNSSNLSSFVSFSQLLNPLQSNSIRGCSAGVRTARNKE